MRRIQGQHSTDSVNAQGTLLKRRIDWHPAVCHGWSEIDADTSCWSPWWIRFDRYSHLLTLLMSQVCWHGSWTHAQSSSGCPLSFQEMLKSVSQGIQRHRGQFVLRSEVRSWLGSRCWNQSGSGFHHFYSCSALESQPGEGFCESMFLWR